MLPDHSISQQYHTMTNYLSLPLELRQQILYFAVKAATEFDESVVRSDGIDFKNSSAIESYLEIATPRFRRHGEFKKNNIVRGIKETFSAEIIHEAVASFPVVQELVRKLLTTHSTTADDLAWVLGRWAQSRDAGDMWKRRGLLNFWLKIRELPLEALDRP